MEFELAVIFWELGVNVFLVCAVIDKVDILGQGRNAAVNGNIRVSYSLFFTIGTFYSCDRFWAGT